MAGLRKWQLDVAGQQQTLDRQFGDREWDYIQRDDTHALLTKISMALFSNNFEELTNERKDSIKATKEKFLQLCGGAGVVRFGVVYVMVLLHENRDHFIIPLIRTKTTYGDDVYFIEQQPGRVYTGWTDFLENNKLPKCIIGYPFDGFYRPRVDQLVNMEFNQISGPSVVGKICDATSLVGKSASSGLILASLFFPMSTPFVIGAAAVLGTSTAYSTTRSVIELKDRSSHYEPIDLTNAGARELWIGMGVDVISTLLIGGATVLPRLVASGRLTSSMASTIMDVLNWVSIGVNSFGVLTNVVVLIGKLRSGTLERSDFMYFISSCLFIANIVVNATVAEKVIQALSNRPSQVANIFQMAVNTSFSAVKSISAVETWESVLDIISGGMPLFILQGVGMPNLANLLQEVRDRFRQFRRGAENIVFLLIDLCGLLRDLLVKALVEISEAWKKTRAFFIRLYSHLNVFRQPSLQVAQIVNNAKRVLDSANIQDEEVRNLVRESIMAAALEMARNLNAQTEQEFSNFAQMAMNDIRRRYERRVIADGNPVLPEDRRAVLQEAIEEFRNEFEANAELPDLNANFNQENNLPLQLLTVTNGFDVYIFQVPNQQQEIDQFIHDAACHLLRDDNFRDHCRFESHGSIVLIQSLGDTLIFYHKPLKDSNSSVGFALLRN